MESEKPTTEAIECTLRDLDWMARGPHDRVLFHDLKTLHYLVREKRVDTALLPRIMVYSREGQFGSYSQLFGK